MSMNKMSLTELEKAIREAKDRSAVYQLLSANEIEITPTKSLSTWLRNSLRDHEYKLNSVLRAARDRLNHFENINA